MFFRISLSRGASVTILKEKHKMRKYSYNLICCIYWNLFYSTNCRDILYYILWLLQQQKVKKRTQQYLTCC